MRNRFRTAGAVAVGMVAALALGACGGGDDEGKVRLATGVDASYAAVFVAEDQGFFEDEGVDVEVSTLEGGPAMAQAVIAGQADMGTQSDATTVSQMASGPRLTALMDFQHSDTYIKVVWGPKVTDAKQIKKIATLPGLMTFATVRYLEEQGIDPDTVELVTATPPDVPVMLKNGDADATVIYEPWAQRTIDEAGGKAVANIGDFGVRYAQWLIADSDWLKENEESAAKVAAAFDKANAFMRDNPEETQKIVEKAIKIPAADTAAIMDELVLETRDLDEEMLANVTETAQFFVDTGAIKEMPDLENQLQLGWWSEHKP